MVVICEECGKVYKLDAEKLKSSMKGKTSKIKCRVCDHVITISLDDENNLDTSSGNIQHVPFQSQHDTNDQMADESETDVSEESPDNQEEDSDQNETIANKIDTDLVETKTSKKKSVSKKTSGIGLRTKMFFLFLVIPLFLMAGSGVFSQLQMLKLASDITFKSTEVVKKLAEQSIIDKAKSVASQCSIFLKNNPDLNKDDFYYDLELNRISIQEVGTKRGYTALIELPDPDKNEDHFIIWCHPDQALIGQPLLPAFKKALGSSYNNFKDVINTLRKGGGNSGYYTWTDDKGITTEKFVAAECIEQSKYMIISTTFIDDFTEPIKMLEKEAHKLTENTRNINIVILVALLLIIGLSITIYGYRLSRSIGKLTEAADRISVGELDVVIEIKSNDEIGALAEAISRMQDSLRFSIERLRRRR
ncbi:MAG: HAMP domain-containing protein [Proteobacteria bacterium]|nr:HAMP domain-containing protein [Pseudomonadota bacterium]